MKKRIRKFRLAGLVFTFALLAFGIVTGITSVFAGLSDSESQTEETGITAEPAVSSEAGTASADPAQETENGSNGTPADPAVQIETARQLQAGDAPDLTGLSEESLRELFYYEPVSEELAAKITGTTFVSGTGLVELEDLSYVRVLYSDFEGQSRIGELIVNSQIAEDITCVFYELYQASYPIEQMVLPDVYGGSDHDSMAANNTSGFSMRPAQDGIAWTSNHAKGMAVDLNPLYNPQVIYSDEEITVLPPEGAPYADRSQTGPYMIDENDTAKQIFESYGFSWGGYWTYRPDYQHFEKVSE